MHQRIHTNPPYFFGINAIVAVRDGYGEEEELDATAGIAGKVRSHRVEVEAKGRSLRGAALAPCKAIRPPWFGSPTLKRGPPKKLRSKTFPFATPAFATWRPTCAHAAALRAASNSKAGGSQCVLYKPNHPSHLTLSRGAALPTCALGGYLLGEDAVDLATLNFYGEGAARVRREIEGEESRTTNGQDSQEIRARSDSRKRLSSIAISLDSHSGSPSLARASFTMSAFCAPIIWTALSSMIGRKILRVSRGATTCRPRHAFGSMCSRPTK